jgi:heme exporter protein C
MRKIWWKYYAIALLVYTFIAGFLIDVPRLPILHETIRNLYFHVSMWFGMIILLICSLVFSIRYLSNSNMKEDLLASEAAKVGIFFGFLGLATGMLWARFTWGAWWVNDPKLNGAAASILVYLAYFMLRSSLDEEQKRARISAVYSIFAFSLMMVFIMILPRLTDSLHPGNGGNPGFGNYDLDRKMRMIFYPAVIGWTLIGVWLWQIRIRIGLIKEAIHGLDDYKNQDFSDK